MHFQSPHFWWLMTTLRVFKQISIIEFCFPNLYKELLQRYAWINMHKFHTKKYVRAQLYNFAKRGVPKRISVIMWHNRWYNKQGHKISARYELTRHTTNDISLIYKIDMHKNHPNIDKYNNKHSIHKQLYKPLKFYKPHINKFLSTTTNTHITHVHYTLKEWKCDEKW
jgi:hypothetical protein